MGKLVGALGFFIPESLTLAPDDSRRRDGVPVTKVCALCKRSKPGYVTWTGQYVCADDINDIVRVRKVKHVSRSIFRGEAFDQPLREQMDDKPKFDAAFWGKWL